MSKESDLRMNAPELFCTYGWGLVHKYNKYPNLEHLNGAISCFEKAIKYASYMNSAIIGLAGCLVKRCQIKICYGMVSDEEYADAKKDLELAVNDLKKVLDKTYENPYAHLNFGLCLYLERVLNGKYDARVLNGNPHSKEAVSDEVISEIETAISLYKSMSLTQDEFYVAHFDLAQLYMVNGDYPKAKKHLGQVANSSSSLKPKAINLLASLKTLK